MKTGCAELPPSCVGGLGVVGIGILQVGQCNLLNKACTPSSFRPFAGYPSTKVDHRAAFAIGGPGLGWLLGP